MPLSRREFLNYGHTLAYELDQQHPGYGLAHNMGYASEDHRDALRRRGPSVIHRRTFQGTQRWLFA